MLKSSKLHTHTIKWVYHPLPLAHSHSHSHSCSRSASLKTSSERVFYLPKVANPGRALAFGYQLKHVTMVMSIIPAHEAPDWLPPPSPPEKQSLCSGESFFFWVSLSLSLSCVPQGRAAEKQKLRHAHILPVYSLDTASLGRDGRALA